MATVHKSDIANSAIMESDTPGKDHRSQLAESLLDAGKRAFDPSSDAASIEAAQREFHQLIDGYVDATRGRYKQGVLTEVLGTAPGTCFPS